MENLIEISHIEKYFGDHCALNDISIQVKKNSIFGLLGPNGAGKTTLLRILNNIIHADRGSITFNGHPLSMEDVEKIGYLPEERGLYKKMKVGEQALYLAQLKGLSQKEAQKRLKEWFEKFEIESWWNRKVMELSKGMQQKVQFIVTVLHNPQLLIFDEPFSGFDPINANLLKKEILQLQEQGTTIIFSSHNMASVEELCDDIALIDNAHLILSGNMKDIKNQFKENRYQIEYLSENAVEFPKEIEVLKQTTNGDLHMDEIALSGRTTINQLLSNLLMQCSIVSLNEILPTMNEIFINAVQNRINKEAKQ